MPELSKEEKAPVRLGVNLDAKSTLAEMGARLEESYASGTSPWSDDETRRFYTDLLDLKDRVPASILGADKKDSGEKDENGGDNIADDEPGSSAENVLPQLSALLSRLPDMASVTLADETAVEFAFLANRPARARLTRTLAGVSEKRYDLVPYYARLAATLNQYMPDVGGGLVSILDTEFRSLQKRQKPRSQVSLRTKNALFLGELTKFGIVPDYIILHAVKSTIDDFSAPSIEVLGVLLETCGRYLLRTPATGEQMGVYLEQLQRKRMAQNLEPRLAMLLENAYYQTCPPERYTKVVKERTPMQLFVQHIFYTKLTKNNMQEIATLLRRLDWNDQPVRHELFKAFTKPWRLRHNQILVVADLVHGLYAYHGAFFVHVCDHMLEMVKQGMDMPRFSENQARRATIVYIGELFNARVLHLNVIVEQLWQLCLYGHPATGPSFDDGSKIDPPDEYLRLVLVCILLTTCAPALGKKVIHRFFYDILLALNALRLSKMKPIPVDVDAQVRQTALAIAGPKWMQTWWTNDVGEARERLAGALSSRACADKGEAEEGEDGDAEDKEEMVDHEDVEYDENKEIPRDEDDADEADEPEPTIDLDSEQRELDDELAKLMSETSTVPSAGAMSGSFLRTYAQSNAPRRTQGDNANGMGFSFLSRRGNKAQMHAVTLPQSSLIAQSTRKAQREEEEERQQLKQYVLAYRERAHDDDTL